MILDSLKKKILREIKPSRDEDLKFKNTVNEFLRKLELSSKELGIKSSFMVGGSFGKGTYLKNSFDVDVFCRFSLDYDDYNLSNLTKKILDSAGIMYFKQKGSRDYFSGFFDFEGFKIKFELVPNLRINSLKEARNSTDYSPFHVDFLKNKSKNNVDIFDEIRLCKQLFKAKGFYGAESYIGGFSGHSIDILLMYYGSLENFLIEAKKWGEVTILDVAKHYSNKDEVLENLDDSKFSNLILVDPILKQRNAARALLPQKYFEFLFFVKNLEKLVLDDFKIEKKTLSSFKEEVELFSKKFNLNGFIYEFDLKEVESEDVCGSKMLKLSSKIKDYYLNFDFKIFKKGFYINFVENKCVFYFLFEKEEFSVYKKVVGPEIFREDALRGFLKNRCEFFVEDKRICSYEKRIYIKIFDIPRLNLEGIKELFSKNLDFIKTFKIIQLK